VNLEFWNKNEVFLNLRKYLQEGIFVRPEVIHVSGVPSHLVDSIVTHLNFPLLYTKNNNPSYKLLIKSIVKVDSSIKFNELLEILQKLHYKRSEYVSDIGEYMVRGDTITIYPYAYDRNIKISFFDKEVEDIRLSDRVDPTEFKNIKSFYLFNNSFLLDNIDKLLFESNSNDFKNVLLIFSNDKEHLSKEDLVFHFDYSFPPIYLSHLELLRKDIHTYLDKGYEVYTNIDKEEVFENKHVKHIDIDVSSGFIDNTSKYFSSEKRSLWKY
jgi:transcription-repair coupling factor (superfamily II helicase)